jgi:hypothetical protein
MVYQCRACTTNRYIPVNLLLTSIHPYLSPLSLSLSLGRLPKVSSTLSLSLRPARAQGRGAVGRRPVRARPRGSGNRRPVQGRATGAVRSEMDSIMSNRTWEVVDHPYGCQPIGCKWIFKKKLRPDGTIKRYKTRLVAKGYT